MITMPACCNIATLEQQMGFSIQALHFKQFRRKLLCLRRQPHVHDGLNHSKAFIQIKDIPVIFDTT